MQTETAFKLRHRVQPLFKTGKNKQFINQTSISAVLCPFTVTLKWIFKEKQVYDIHVYTCMYMCFFFIYVFICVHFCVYTHTNTHYWSKSFSQLFFQHILTYASQQCIPVVIVSVKRKQSSKTWCSLSLPELKLWHFSRSSGVWVLCLLNYFEKTNNWADRQTWKGSIMHCVIGQCKTGWRSACWRVWWEAFFLSLTVMAKRKHIICQF